MPKKDLFPENPMDSIAKIVQREFEKKATKEFLEKTNLTAPEKKSKTIAFEAPDDFPPMPSMNGYQSKRSVREDRPVALRNPSDNPLDWKESADEIDELNPLDPEGSIYDESEDGTPGETPLTNEESALQLALAIRKGHERGRPDIDWHLVKLLYVYGGWTYERIGSECNVSYSLIRLHGRRGRWPEARDSYRREQSQKISEKIAMEEDRLRDWQMLKRRQAGIEGLSWFTKAISNLRDDASPESIAKLGGLLDRMLSSVTGLTPVEQAAGSGVNVRVENTQVSLGATSYAPNSPQAKLAEVWERKIGENETDHTRRLALVIRDLYVECERAGLYTALELGAEEQRQTKLRNRLGIEDDISVFDASGKQVS